MSEIAMICASHTPLLMRSELAGPGVMEAVAASFGRLADFVSDFAPEQIIQFAPDHFHGFHYDLMPSFCVGAAARSCGDWATSAGPLNVDEAQALALLEAIRDHDVDAAVSYDMIVDHGFVQLWEIMFGSFATLPILPVFVNTVGHPLPKYRRARRLGEACGHFAARSNRRVLFVASGGLSHDPLVPRMRGASPEIRERLLGRTKVSGEGQMARERAVHAAGLAAMRGEGSARPLAPEWDERFLDDFARCDWAAIDAMEPDEVDRIAGSGGNEVLAWVAAGGRPPPPPPAAGGFTVVQRDYRAIPGWIAGLAVVAACG